MYANVLNGRSMKKVIVHCGSGVTACHTILAMVHAGMDVPAIYTGSYSEWIRQGMPHATVL
jgi:thiosulfate/3-mercaptopyruvate sulfurtransferase